VIGQSSPQRLCRELSRTPRRAQRELDWGWILGIGGKGSCSAPLLAQEANSCKI
jgi:hypothetical protein